MFSANRAVNIHSLGSDHNDEIEIELAVDTVEEIE
jgi:hypothetical protein